MVAITVILAAVIAAFVFGMGTPTQAPQASIRASGAYASSSYVKLEHQGGADITLSLVKVIAEQGTNRVSWTAASNNSANKFQSGDSLYIYTNTTTDIYKNGPSSSGTPLNATGKTGEFALTTGYDVTVTLIDVPSGQQIAKTTVRSGA